MGSEQSTIPTSLLVHDGELEDLRGVLEKLGTPFVERRGALLEADQERTWDLVVSSPGRMLSLQLQGQPTRIVVTGQDSKTLRNSLQRAGIELMVRRPVHPAALRALILHALYRGPEKRRDRRVAVGAPIRIRTAFRQLPGVLADLSLGGCRLLAEQGIGTGKPFALVIPAEIAPGKAYRLRAHVVQCGETPDASGMVTLHARFDAPSQRKLKLLKQTLLAYRGGPARLAPAAQGEADAEAKPARPATPARPVATTRPARAPEPARPSLPIAGPASAEPEKPPAHTGADPADSNAFEGRAAQLEAEADHILMGRDISISGMVVSPSPLLTIGTNVKLGIHLNAGAPLQISARVHRDDGERGVVLRFHQPSPEASAALMKLMQAPPVVAPGNTHDGAACVVSELLEVGTA